MYCIAKKPTPLLNTPDFQSVFGNKQLPLDEKGLLRSIEMIAFPGTKFEVLDQSSPSIYKVITKDYPHGPQYIHSHFVKLVKAAFPEREKILPEKKNIFMQLTCSIGAPYVWGGNWKKGIPDICSLYAPNISKDLRPLWMLAGLDCSGLLYEATNGYTPRNTSKLFHFGETVSSFSNVKPLDILLWPGHVLIFLTPTLFIESLYGKGVLVTPLKTRLLQISSKEYVIRRFI